MREEEREGWGITTLHDYFVSRSSPTVLSLLQLHCGSNSEKILSKPTSLSKQG